MRITKITYGLETRVENPMKYAHPDAKFDSMKPYVSMEASLDETDSVEECYTDLRRVVRDKLKEEEKACAKRMEAKTRKLLAGAPTSPSLDTPS